MLRRFQFVSAVLVSFWLSACMVGPDFKSPQAPSVKNYTAAESDSKHLATDAPELVSGKDIPAQWWSVYRSAALEKLIRLGLKDSPDVQSAQATLRALQQDYASQSGAILYPQVDASVKSDRRSLSGVSFGQNGNFIYTLHDASVNVSYTLDFFGGGRRYLEALRAGVDYQGYQLEAAHLALTANIVTSAIGEASLNAQLLATQQVVDNARHQLAIVEQQGKLGVVTPSVVLNQRALLARAEVLLPPLEKQLTQMKHRISVLVGRFPSQQMSASKGMPDFALESLHLPDQLPLSLPSELVHQRPDIRAAEALLHQASAQVGLATANLYPSLTINAGYGKEAVKFGDLLSGPSSSVWNLGSNLLQPLFHGGELTAKRRQALATFDAARAQYRQTLLQAFQNVADVLLALKMDARTLALQEKSAALSSEALHLVEQQFSLGAASFLALLNAQQAFQQSQISVVQARALLMSDTAALFQAMGGGWWQRDDAYQSLSGEREM
ncbi:MAG: efflux transporter outer membrane subunit [Mariprofundaceae bacterium]|nr:efflux transporter outer membrane subunit [Mariprofundaceae bacterium]